MWPWEHLTVGYLCYSAYARVVHGEPPGNSDAVVLALATQLPDLVDKPLAWWLGVLPNGTSLAHSLLVAVPVCLLVVVTAGRVDAPAVGRAFTVGYLSHLCGDVCYPLVTDGAVRVAFLLWPVVPGPETPPTGLFAQALLYFDDFVAFLATSRGQLYVLFEALLLTIGLAVWVADSYPGPGALRRDPDV